MELLLSCTKPRMFSWSLAAANFTNILKGYFTITSQAPGKWFNYRSAYEAALKSMSICLLDPLRTVT